MTKTQKKKSVLDDIELLPDAWDRFEGFVKTKVRAASSQKTVSRPKPATNKTRKAT